MDPRHRTVKQLHEKLCRPSVHARLLPPCISDHRELLMHARAGRKPKIWKNTEWRFRKQSWIGTVELPQWRGTRSQSYDLAFLNVEDPTPKSANADPKTSTINTCTRQQEV